MIASFPNVNVVNNVSFQNTVIWNFLHSSIIFKANWKYLIVDPATIYTFLYHYRKRLPVCPNRTNSVCCEELWKQLDDISLQLEGFGSIWFDAYSKFSWYPTIEFWILQPNIHYCIIMIQNEKRNLTFLAFCDTQQNGCRFRDNPQFNCGFYDQIYIIVLLLQNKKRNLVFHLTRNYVHT